MNKLSEQEIAVEQVDRFKSALGPFVVAAESTRMAMVFINARSSNYAIVFANNSFLRLFGYEIDQVMGRSLDSLMPNDCELSCIDDILNRDCDNNDASEIECKAKDGSTIWVALCVTAVESDCGEIEQYCLSFIDISVQVKRTENERAALHAIYEHAPNFIALTDGPEHRFTFANAAFQRLVGPRDLLGLSLVEAFPELEIDEILRQLANSYASGAPIHRESMPLLLRARPGEDPRPRFVDLFCQPVRGPQGEVTGMFWEGHDVTEQNAAAKQLQLLQSKLIHLSRVSAMGTMAATLAHELNQPLTAILNYAATCAYRNRAEGDNVAAIASGLDAICDGANRGAEIIRRLRDLSVRRSSHREVFDVKEAVRESIILVRAGAGAGIEIEDRCRGLVNISADRIQIQQVMMNLIRNACEAVAENGGKVRVSTTMRNGRAIVSVADTGMGVSRAAVETLFTWTETAKSNGTGMGLSICRTIVEAHGGKLWLEKSGSEGSCFSFSLPAQILLPLKGNLAGPAFSRRVSRKPGRSAAAVA